MKVFCSILVLASSSAYAFDYYDDKDYWSADWESQTTMMSEMHHPSRFLELDSGGSYSFEEVYGLMHKIGMADCDRTAKEEYDKMIVRAAVPGVMCAAMGRASPAIGGVCAGYIAVREFFEKRGIEVREKQCQNTINEKWSIRGERIE